MKSKRMKWMQHMIVFVLVIAMLLPMSSPVSVQAAEKDLYLAYQNTEYGESVVTLETPWEREDYKVTELFLRKGDKADLCFINASKWKEPKWTSSNSKVASVDSSGVITAVSDGVAEITLTYTKKGLLGKKVSASAMVYVGEGNWDINIGASSLCCFLDTYNLKVGSKIEIDLFERQMNKNGENRSSYAKQSWVRVEWKSTNDAVVQVYGLHGQTMEAEKAGSAVISAIITNEVLNTSIEKSITVNVTKQAYDESVAWDNKYYQMYGENYKRMFQTAALESTADIEMDLLDDAFINLNTKLQAIGISGFAELADITNGLTIAFESILNGKNYYEEKIHQEAIVHLIKEMTLKDSLNQHYISNVQEALEKAEGLFTDLDNVNEISEIVKKIEKAGLKIPENETKTIAEYVMHDAAGDIKDLLSEGVTISEYLALTICLYEIDCKILDDLQKCSKPGEALYEDVELVRKAKEEDPVNFFKEKYCTDVFARIAVKTIVKLASKNAMNVMTVVGDFIVMCTEMAGVNKLSELTKATYFMEYTVCAVETAESLRKEIMTNFDSYTDEELMKKIDEYETVYRVFLSTCEIALQAIADLDSSCRDALYDDRNIIMDMYHYDTHVASAMVWYMNQNPNADEHESVFEKSSEKKQYGYYHYTDGKGDYATCADLGQNEGWKNIYREEIWIDEPLKLISTTATILKHPETRSCKATGCLEGDFWNAGGRYIDENGVIWYREQTRMVSASTGEIQNRIVIKETSTVSGNGNIADSVLQARMEELVSELLRANRGASNNENATEAYFTTTGKIYKADSGDTCKNTKVVKEKWFTDVFGTVNVDNFPKHLQSKGNGDSNIGYSCFGFACFAQWYIYKNSNNDKITATQIASGEYTKDFLKNNLQVGDIIRIYISKNGSTYYHSMVFHSFTENGMIVLDCNRNTDNKVRLNEIKFNRDGWSGDPVWIYRVQE